jgi:EF-hand domain-containing family member B
MSNFGKFKDRNPGLRPAGVITTIPDDSTKACVQPPPPREMTPEKIKKYRKSFNDEPGMKQIHYGVVEDPLPPSAFTYGKKTYVSDHVHEIIASKKPQTLANFQTELKEQKYSSSIREPLGKGYERGYQYPQEVHSDKFKFGQVTIPSESSKVLIFPPNGITEESKEVQNLYFRSHGLTQAGEQMTRNYQLPFDKNEHRFGLSEPPELNGVVRALQPESFGGIHPKTEIIKKVVEDHRNVNSELLGKSKNLGTGKMGNTDQVFGIPTYKEPWNVGQCIRGQPDVNDLLPDKDLGKSTRFGFRNSVKNGDESRQFGVPTIRNDITNKTFKSVADPNNYGNEASVVQLLYPDFWLRHGIDDKEFTRSRPLDDIRSLFEAIGISMGIGKLNAIANKAYEMFGVVSLESFIHGMRWYEDRGLN